MMLVDAIGWKIERRQQETNFCVRTKSVEIVVWSRPNTPLIDQGHRQPAGFRRAIDNDRPRCNRRKKRRKPSELGAYPCDMCVPHTFNWRILQAAPGVRSPIRTEACDICLIGVKENK